MPRPKAEWDPSWDDDWQSAQSELKEDIETERPHDPEKAIELYRHGFVTARGRPMHDWSVVESDLYQDYMSGSTELDEAGEERTDWEQARAWVRRGWEAGRP